MLTTNLAPHTARNLSNLSRSVESTALRARLALDSARGCAHHALSSMRAIESLRSARMESSARGTEAGAAMRRAAVEIAKGTGEAFDSFAGYSLPGLGSHIGQTHMLEEIERAPLAFDRELFAIKSAAFDAAAELQGIIDSRGGFCAPLERARDRAHRVACMSPIGMDRHDTEEIAQAVDHAGAIFRSIAKNRSPLGDSRICSDETRRLSCALATARRGWATACDAAQAVTALRSALEELDAMRD